MPYDLHIVLVEPLIPQNTGNIGRLCLATGAKLHLVEPLGFDISEKRVRRAGLDYWQYLEKETHPSLDAFEASLPAGAPLALFTKRAGITLYERAFTPGTYLVFGKETSGLPEWFTQKRALDCVRIPMFDARVRSLNLSNAASIAVYEAIRQLGG